MSSPSPRNNPLMTRGKERIFIFDTSLLHNLGKQFKITNTADQIEAEMKAFASVTIAIGYDFEPFDTPNDMLDFHALA